MLSSRFLIWLSSRADALDLSYYLPKQTRPFFANKKKDKGEWRFGARVHLHPVLFSKFEKYENASKKSEKNWAETYTSVEHSCKIAK